MAFDLDSELDLEKPRLPEKIVEPVTNEVSFGDYIADIVRAPLGGVSDAVQGLITLGALPIDYALDTNLTRNIDNFFDKYTPDARTGVGEVVQTLVQFGLPLGVASKVAPGIKILKGAQVTKLSSLSGAAKGTELAKRAGYFGGLGGVVDLAVSNPGDQKSLTDSLGLTESKDIDRLDGRERAAEIFKQKLKFGAEGAIIGGGIPLLPTAGSLGYKYGIKPVAKVASPVVGTTFRVLDKAIFNPLAQGIAGKGSKSLASDILNKSGNVLKTVYDKTGLPPASEWKKFDAGSGSFTERLMKKIDNLKTNFTSTGGVQFPEIKKIQSEVDAISNSEVKNLKRVQERINNTLYDVVSKFKTNYYDIAQYKATRTGNYTNIMDNLTAEKNKLFDYLLAQGREADTALTKVNKSIIPEAKELKKILKNSNKRYYNLISANPTLANKEMAQALVENADGFFKQRFAAFNNKSFQFDPITGPIGSKALKAVKDIVKSDPGYRRETTRLAERLMTKNPKLKFKDALEEAFEQDSKRILNEVKYATIRAGVDPDQYIKRLGGLLKTDEAGAANLMKPGESFPDAIKRYLNQEKNAKVTTKDYENALVDTVLYQSKQYHAKNYFDEVEKILGSKGALFDAEQASTRPGLSPIKAQYNAKSGVNPEVDVAFESSLFKDNYTYPEIANALVETKAAFDNFFDFPLYKSLMSVKAGAQIAKTIFSPMTQVRNVTTASFFPLMNGLIGSRASVSDSFKLVAEDIFSGAKTNLPKLNAEIEDMVRRGVIDQNIQVNEIRSILNKAKDGAISMESFMNNPTVKKFVDVYQGGDNVWKVYSDKFYQSALKDAFSYVTPEQAKRGLKGGDEALQLENIKEWYRTIAKEDFVENSIFTGQAKTADEALKDVSAYLVTNTIPTYSKVPQVIQAIRNLPLGNFIAFPAEILRTSSNVLALGAKELTSTNPYIRQMGARRVIGASATLGGIGTAVGSVAQYVTGVDKEKLDSAKRSFVPVYEKNATLIPLSAPDRQGKFKYFNFSYSNPYDTLVRPFNAILGAFSDGTLTNDNAEAKVFSALFGNPVTNRPGALSEFFSPFISESIGTERIADVTLRNGESINGSRIYNPQDTIGVKINKSLNHIIGGLEPGAFNQARRVWEGATGQFTDAGTARNTVDEIAAIMSGVRVQEVKPLASMPFILSSYSKDKQNIGGKFARTAYSARTSPEEALSAWKTYVMESYDSQTKMFNTVRDAKRLGIDEFEIKSLVQDRIKNRGETDKIMNGEFKPPNYSKERYKSLIRRVASEDLRSSIKLENNVQRLTEIFDDVKRELNFMGLNKSMDEVSATVDRIFRPLLPSARRLPSTDTLFQPSRPPAQAPSLPTNITGNPVNPNVVSQNFGNRFNLTKSLSPEQKIDYLFDDRG